MNRVSDPAVATSLGRGARDREGLLTGLASDRAIRSACYEAAVRCAP